MNDNTKFPKECIADCFQLLEKIKSILENKDLSDKDCFYAIEEIVTAFENAGIALSYRHDF